MTELHTLQYDHHNIEFKWVEIRTTEAGLRLSEDNMIHLIGFNPSFNDEPSTNHRLGPEEYPLFDLNPEKVDFYKDALA